MHLRIISGKNRGLTLETIEGLDTRPTLDRVRESVFNILFDRVIDKNILDLFAGSGAMGIEALSRYAKSCTFIDNNKEAVKCILKNIEKSKNSDFAKTICDDYKNFLHKYNGEGFDIVFVDPPYKMWQSEKILTDILKADILNDDAIIIAECERNCELNYEGFSLLTKKDYGKVSIYLLTKENHI